MKGEIRLSYRQARLVATVLAASLLALSIAQRDLILVAASAANLVFAIVVGRLGD